MPIKVACACGKKLAVKDELAGKKVKCPACQKALSIPKPKVAEDDWDLGDSVEEDFADEPVKSRGGKSSASRGAVSRKSSVKGQGKKSKSSNRGLLIGLSAGGGVLVVALLAWLLWPKAPAANVAGNPPGNQELTSPPANSTGVAPVATANSSTASNPAATTGDIVKPINSFPQVIGVQQPLTLGGLGWTVGSVAFSPDGKRLASPSQMMNVKLWDTMNGQEALTLKGHTNLVNGVAFSPDGKRLASASGDKTIKLWDTASGQETLTMKGHTHIVYRVAFSPDGKRLVSGSFDKTAMVWDATNGQELLTLKGHITYVTAVAFSPDGKRLATASDKTVKLWDATSGQETATLNGHEGPVGGVAFSPDGKRLVSASTDKSLKLWDPTTGQETLTLKGHSDGLNEVAFSPDGKWLATASLDKTLKVWDVTSGQETLTLTGHGDWVTSVAFSPDGKRLASGSKDQTVKVWDISNPANSTGTARSAPTNALANDARGDIKALQGAWQMSDLEVANPLSAANKADTIKSMQCSFQGETLTLSVSNQKSTSSVKLDPSQNPKAIDLTSLDGPAKGKTQLGIYTLDGDTLKLCFASVAGVRPKEFKPDKAAIQHVMVFKRGSPVATAPSAPANAVAPGAVFDHNAWKQVEPKLKAKGIQAQLMDHRGDPDTTPDSPTHSALVDIPVRQANGGIPDDLMQLLTPISHLAIRSTSMSDVGLKQLSECPGLTAVAVNDRWSVTPKGLVGLMNCQKLRALYLNNTSISFDHLTAIKELTALRVLQINLMPLSPEMLAVIGDMNLLLSLSLQKSELTDEGLLQIAKLTKLKSMLLDDNPITDQGLQHLKSLPDLKLLSLRSLNVSAQAVDELQKALPRCQILK